MLHIGIAIALLVLCSSYKSCPIVSKLTGIKVLTIILTVLASIKLMSFLFGTISNPALKECDTVEVNTDLPAAANPLLSDIPEPRQSDMR